MNKEQVHHGRNVKFIREMRGMKKERLALLLGNGWTSINVSVMEISAEIDRTTLQQVAVALAVSVEEILHPQSKPKEMPPANTLESNWPVSDPVHKIIEHYEAMVALYERMLHEKDELLGQIIRKL